MADNQVYQGGASYQKYVLNASNSLAVFLARILDNMQQSMMGGQGQGKGKGFQLPDIIQSQQQLQEKMSGKGQSSGRESSGSGESEGSSKGEGGGGKDGKKESKARDHKVMV